MKAERSESAFRSKARASPPTAVGLLAPPCPSPALIPAWQCKARRTRNSRLYYHHRRRPLLLLIGAAARHGPRSRNILPLLLLLACFVKRSRRFHLGICRYRRRRLKLRTRFISRFRTLHQRYRTLEGLIGR